MITCGDARLAERIRRIRSGGITRDFAGSRGGYDYMATEIGSNHHLTELQAALGLVQLGRCSEFIRQRERAGQRMLRRLSALGDRVHLPVHPQGSSWNLFIVEVESTERQWILEELRDHGVNAHVHYPLLHRQPVFNAAADETRLPSAVQYEARALTLPLFADITEHQIECVADALAACLERTGSKAKIGTLR